MTEKYDGPSMEYYDPPADVYMCRRCERQSRSDSVVDYDCKHCGLREICEDCQSVHSCGEAGE